MKVTLEEWDGAHRRVFTRTTHKTVGGNPIVKDGGRWWHLKREDGKWVLGQEANAPGERNPSKRKTLKRVGKALKKWIRGNPSQGLGLTEAQIKARIRDLKASLPAQSRERQRVMTIYRRELRRLKSNPSRVKGRKVKGGRAVTLKNMKSVTITRKSNGVVSVRGVQLRGRKR